MLLPYAALLKSMVFQGQPLEPSFRDWSLMTAFSRLERLRLREFGFRSDSLNATLRQMRHLSEVEIFYVAWHANTLPVDCVDAVFSLTQLKSLILEPYTDYSPSVPSGMTHPITAMEQLTRLSLYGPLCGSSLRQLTKMIDLQIVGFKNTTLDLNDLTTMRNLTSLKIYSAFDLIQFPSSVLHQLKKLKTLTLWKMDAYSDLRTVMTLPNLTELGVVRQCCLRNRNGYLSDQTSVSNLRTLAVDCEWPIKETQIHIPKRCMPKVQKIKFVLEKYMCKKPWKSIMKSLESSLKWPDLIHMFPCLRCVSFVLADAYGRPFEEYRMFAGVDLS